MSLLNSSCEYNLTKTKDKYPLSLVEVKRHLRVDPDFIDDDNYLDGLIVAATTLAESYINKDIAYTLNELKIHDFYSDYVQIYEGNFASVLDVYNENDVSTGTIDYTNNYNNSFQITWTAPIEGDPLTIKFYTGFNDYTCPALLKQAILIKLADLYDSARADYNWQGLTDNKVFETILNYYVALRF